MRLLGHIDWSGARRASAELTRIVGGPVPGSVIDDGLRAALASIGGVDAVGEIDRIFLAGDVRIDNLGDLRSRLDTDARESTAQVLIRAYLAWGDKFSDQLVGDFAFILWDARRRRLLASRDPFGVRPLVYRALGDRLWLASSSALLLSTLDGPPVLDDTKICEHLLWRYKSTDLTFFRAIRELPPGHVLTVVDSCTTLQRYWFPPRHRSDLTKLPKEDLCTEVRRLFVQSVERRLRSDRSVIVHLSGGLDSSSIAMATDYLLSSGRSIAPGAIGASEIFPGLDCDEGNFIDVVARAIRFPVERWDGTKSNPIDLVEPTLDGPGLRVTATSGHDGDVTIAKNSGAAVILSGHGGDDLMMAVGFIRDMVSRGEWAGAAKATFRPTGMGFRSRLRRIRTIASHFLPDGVRRARARSSASVPTWLAPEWHNVAMDIEVQNTTGLVFQTYVQELAWSRLTSAHAQRAIGAMQRRAASMGFEYRFPFLDRDLVEFVLSLPPHCLPGPTYYARIHREAFRPMLPPEIYERHGKADFTPALMNRIQQAHGLIHQIFSTEWASEKYVTRKAAFDFCRSVTMRGRQSGSMDWWRVWGLVTLEVWIRGILRYRAPPRSQLRHEPLETAG